MARAQSGNGRRSGFRYLTGDYRGTTSVVSCSRQCFGSIPGFRIQPRHSSCCHSHTPTHPPPPRNARARITFVCSTEPKTAAAAPTCCSPGLASCPSKRHPPAKRNKNWTKMLLTSPFFRVIFLHCLDLSNPSLFFSVSFH